MGTGRRLHRLTKEQLDASVAAEAARDAEFANALALEQTQRAELKRRFDELERQLAALSRQ